MKLTADTWNVMEPHSTQVATTAESDNMFMADPAAGCKLLCEHADLEYKASAKDDPTGLSALLSDNAPVDDGSSSSSAEIARVPIEADGGNDLDMSKGKEERQGRRSLP